MLIGIWVVFVFAGALARANELGGQAARELAINEQMRQQVADGQAEIGFIQSHPFLSFEARSYGMGKRGERAFALAPGAPSPAPIIPLGDTAPTTAESRGPLDDWLSTFFGR